MNLYFTFYSVCVQTQDNCRLTYEANGALGYYAVALQVEDFASAASTVAMSREDFASAASTVAMSREVFVSAASTVAMSSVPVQFLVLVQNVTAPPGVTAPTFVALSDSCRWLLHSSQWHLPTADHCQEWRR